MYVIGAQKLRSFSEKRPEAEAPLGALFAVLNDGSWPSQKALMVALGEIVSASADGSIEIALPSCGAVVTLKANYAAGVILIDKIFRSEA